MRYRFKVLVLLNLFLGVWLILQSASRTGTSLNQSSLPSLSELKQIQIVLGHKRQIILTPKDDSWEVVGSTLKSNQHVIGQLSEIFERPLRADQTIDCSPKKCIQFGIDSDSISVSLGRLDGSSISFRIGRVVDDKYTYIQFGDTASVHRIPANLRAMFDRPRLSWLRTQLFDEQPKNIQMVRRRTNTKIDWEFSRKSPTGKWQFVRPEGIQIGQYEASAVAHTLAGVKAHRIMDSHMTARPNVTLEAQTFGGRRLKLDIETADSKVYQAMAWEYGKTGWDPIGQKVTIPNYQAVFLIPQLNDLKNTRVFSFSPSDAVALKITGSKTLALIRGETSTWTMTSPVAHKELIRHFVDDFVEAVIGIKAAGPAQKPAKDAFDIIQKSVSVQLKSGKHIVLEIGRTYGKDGAWARVQGAPDHAWILSRSKISLLETDGNRLIKR